MGDIVYFTRMADLPNRIRELRKAQGWTLEYLAGKLDCSIPQIGDMERGMRTLSYDWMLRISAALGVAPGDLLHDRDVPDRLTDEERAMLDRFRLASDDQRDQLRRLADVIVPFRAQPPDEDRDKAA